LLIDAISWLQHQKWARQSELYLIEDKYRAAFVALKMLQAFIETQFLVSNED